MPPPPPSASFYLSGHVILSPPSFQETISGIRGFLNGVQTYSYTGEATAGGGVSIGSTVAAPGVYDMVLHLTGQVVAVYTYTALATVTTVSLLGSDIRTHTFPTRSVTMRQGDTLAYRFTIPLP